MRYIISLLLVVLIGALSATTIYDIQYTTNAGNGTYPSPMVGQIVTVEGIVTAIGMQGDKYFISEPQGGAWRGIFVFDFATLPQVGDLVSVTGTVAEYYGVTELSYVTGTILSSGNPLPPLTHITTGSLNSGATAEQYEGVLVAVSRATVSSDTATNGHNQFGINDGTGECLVDDDMYGDYNVSVGQTLDMIGICHYSYDMYKVFPRTAQDLLPYGTSNAKKSWGRIKSIYR
ncbi:MAG: hypothetical protein JXR56_02815 [Candidatus Cloacimonetes bacterium]|nr:hypothetical protein [Candidatus Cloacimonadota bacterium]